MSQEFIRLGETLRARIDDSLRQLVADQVASRLSGSDHTLWGPDAEPEAKIRLGWLQSTLVSAPFVAELEELGKQLRADGMRHVVLGGMGGSSLAPEVITATAGVDLTVLDATEPSQLRAALADRLDETVVVISSKSGSTVETDSHRRAYEQAFADAGIDPRDRIIVVTDPGSPLHESASAAGYRVFLADPAVGGRFSALTAFGLVPSALAGADIATLLRDSASIQDALAADSPENPGLVLGAAIASGVPAIDKLALIDNGSPAIGLGNWVEQLIAESTGKEGTGLLPIVLAADEFEANHVLADVLPIRLVPALTEPETDEVQLTGSLGAQFLLWEFATAVAGRILGINPFDQPDVESAKVATRALLEHRPEPTPARFTERGIEVRGDERLLHGVSTLSQALRVLLDSCDNQGYIAIQAYLNRHSCAAFSTLRESIAVATRRPTTFGWGPRFLHSTGQYHKGGSPRGVFLQLCSATETDLAIPGRPFTFGELLTAQAAGDASVLSGLGRPVISFTLPNPQRDLATLRAALADATSATT